MASSGTYDFSSSPASGLTLVAFSRIGIRRTEIQAQHLTDAGIEANLLQVELGNNQPNLWRTEVYNITLTAGTATYNLPARMIAIQDVYITTTPSGGSSGSDTDRLLAPLSFLEYDSQSNKTQQAPPTSYLINKTLTPTITFWQVPDDSASYVVHVRMLGQVQDASQRNGTTLDLPYSYLDAYVAGLAYRLSRSYAPDKEVLRKQDWVDALAAAQRTDTQDNVGLYIQPDFSGYNRS